MSGRVVWAIYESPLGPLTITAGRGGVGGLHFPGRAPILDQSAHRPQLLAGATRELEEYFAGERQGFELELDLGGTPFQRRVWDELLRIPYGTTVGYTELANRVGRPDRLRAVAGAVGRTPVPIIVPCHRAVGSNGALTGYRGGLQRKRALLDLERRAVAGHASEPGWAFRQLAML